MHGGDLHDTIVPNWLEELAPVMAAGSGAHPRNAEGTFRLNVNRVSYSWIASIGLFVEELGGWLPWPPP